MKKINNYLLFGLISLFSGLCFAGESTALNREFLDLAFYSFIAITVGATLYAGYKTRTAGEFYTASGNVGGFTNGLALAGDYLSAASFLAISGMIFSNGYDGLIFSIGWLVGWPVLTFLLAERFKNIGKYTWTDAVARRFEQKPIRIFATVTSLTVVLLYTIAQMVGAGTILKIAFGFEFKSGVIIVGLLTMTYVLIGGMRATTFVQTLKAIMLLGATSFMALAVMKAVNFSPEILFQKSIELHAKKDAIMVPGGFIKDPVTALSVGIALMFGTAGLPHILQRFLTVKDAKEARKSVVWGSTWIGYFYFLTFIIGFGAIVLLNQQPELFFNAGDATKGILGGNNMVAVFLGTATGGTEYGAFIAVVAFATICAVVTGLTLAGTSALSHDLYKYVIRDGKASDKEELNVARLSSIIIAMAGIGLGIAFEKQNIGFMVTLAFTVAASSIFPVLAMTILWKDTTTKGAVTGGWTGYAIAVLLTIISPPIWEAVLGNKPGSSLFPFGSPALFSMLIAFAVIWIISLIDNNEKTEVERQKFDEQEVIAEFGKENLE